MQVLRAADYKRMPWKNGGGETVEIAVFPPQASLDDFGWRISMATVAADGPFSAFPGVDRTLSILSGAGMELDIAGHPPIVLDGEAEPYFFEADLETSARLIGGPITDLNVMTRRTVFGHTVERRQGPGSISSEQGNRLLLCMTGKLTIESARQAVVLEPLDALFLDPGEATFVTGNERFFLVTIDRM